MPTVPEILHQAAETYDQRNKLYGDNYKRWGAIFNLMFPEGVKISSTEDANRLGIFVQCLSKMTRYAESFNDGGHQDSAHDMCVYSAMLEELTERK